MPACVACGTVLHDLLDKAGHAVHHGCDPLAIHPDVVASELFDLIATAILEQPRSLQKRIGPSEVGIPCDRRIGYILADTPKVQTNVAVPWKSTIGTAMHEFLAVIMGKANVALLADGAPNRWMIEDKVAIGDIDGVTITGSTDLFDTWTGTVVDWKFTTRNKIRESYRPHGPGEQYRTQAHSYGKGWEAAGFHVRNVMIVFFTRDGEFVDRHVWHEPYDRTVADAALARANTIAKADGAHALATAPAYCNYCPWFRKGAPNLSVACPGHPTEDVESAYPFDELLPSPEKAA